MKILLIDIEKEKEAKSNNDDLNNSFNIKLLDHLIDSESDIKKVEKYTEAFNFIDELTRQKKFIDFIIINNKSSNLSETSDFVLKVRESKETYFNGYFNLSAICIIVITSHLFDGKIIKENLYSRIINSHFKESKLIDELGLAITYWRQLLAGELDELNLDLNLNFKDFNANWALRFKLHKLHILSSKFISDQQKFSFLWLGDNLKTIDYSVDQFQKLIKSQVTLKEKQIHKYLRENEKFLLGENKSCYTYEKQLYYQNSRKYIEVDFINHPHSYLFDNPEAFEIKLPEKKIIRKDGKNVLSHFDRYLNQVNKYQSYLTDEKNINEIKDRLKENFHPFDYTMLFSRQEFVDDYSEMINQRLDTLPFKLKFITYDHLINRFEKLYERTKKYRIY